MTISLDHLPDGLYRVVAGERLVLTIAEIRALNAMLEDAIANADAELERIA